jgi:hypothetical protein
MIGMVISIMYHLILLSWGFCGVTEENFEKSLLVKSFIDFSAAAYI